MSWTLDCKVLVNGRIGEAEIIAYGEDGSVLTTDGGRFHSLPSRQKIAKRLATKLNAPPEQVEEQVEAAWNKSIGDHLAASAKKAADTVAAGEEEQKGEHHTSAATALVGMVRGSGAELFHTPDNEAFTSVQIAETRQVWSLRSKGFRQWLSRSYFNLTQRTPGSQALADATNVLEGMAVHDGEQRDVHVRVALHQGRLYLDLVDAGWRVVEIDTTGWRILDRSPVPFRRPKGLTALPAPERGGSVDDLRPFVNVASEEDWRLMVACLLQAFRPGKPSPVLCLHGEQGCAKSTTARVIRSLIDPNVASLRKEPREDRDLVIAASNSWLIVYDNLSAIPPWLSDALCRLATGGGLSTRELYSDKEEAIFDVMRPVVLTSIEDLASRGDLLERAVVLRLPRITDDKRQTEAEFWAAFEAARPRILGAMLDAVSSALANANRVRLKGLPRMADFCQWASDAGHALGWKDGAFLAAYRGNRADANEMALDADVIVPHLRKFAQAHSPWEGTAAELLLALNTAVVGNETKEKDWPKKAHTLSGRLRRLSPNLRAIGLLIEFDRQSDASRRRIIRVTQERECSEASRASRASMDLPQASLEGEGSVLDAPLFEKRPESVQEASESSEEASRASNLDAGSPGSVQSQEPTTQGDTAPLDASDALDASSRPFSDEETRTPWDD